MAYNYRAKAKPLKFCGCANAMYTAVFLQLLLPLHFACLGKQSGQHTFIEIHEMMIFPVKRVSEEK